MSSTLCGVFNSEGKIVFKTAARMLMKKCVNFNNYASKPHRLALIGI